MQLVCWKNFPNRKLNKHLSYIALCPNKSPQRAIKAGMPLAKCDLRPPRLAYVRSARKSVISHNAYVFYTNWNLYIYRTFSMVHYWGCLIMGPIPQALLLFGAGLKDKRPSGPFVLNNWNNSKKYERQTNCLLVIVVWFAKRLSFVK